MRRHRGQHPRIGAADVVPFVPLQDVSMAECARLARELGEKVGRSLRLPVYLYGQAARQESHRSLAALRRGGYEGLREGVATGAAPQPDYGPRSLGPAGACAIGAREILIAFNVYLATDDVAVAGRIARAVRASSGGLPGLQALGLLVKGRAQVSMNLTDYRRTSIHRAIEAVQRQAEAFGVALHSTELIGLLPREALLDADGAKARIDNFSPERVLERRLAQELGDAWQDRDV